MTMLKEKEKRRKVLIEKINNHEVLQKETISNNNGLYESLKDFTLSANKTDDVLKKMKSNNSEILKIKRIIEKARKELSEV